MHQQAVAPLLEGSTAADPDVLDAMALLTRETGLVVHVVAPRSPLFLVRASELAEQGGVGVQVDTLPKTARVRFSR
jgi:hypothetical protein